MSRDVSSRVEYGSTAARSTKLSHPPARRTDMHKCRTALPSVIVSHPHMERSFGTEGELDVNGTAQTLPM